MSTVYAQPNMFTQELKIKKCFSHRYLVLIYYSMVSVLHLFFIGIRNKILKGAAIYSVCCGVKTSSSVNRQALIFCNIFVKWMSIFNCLFADITSFQSTHDSAFLKPRSLFITDVVKYRKYHSLAHQSE